VSAEPQAPVPPLSGENPAWSGWDVLSIAFLTVASVVVFLFLLTYAGQRFLYPRLPVVEVAKFPLITLVAQLLAYVLVMAFMVTLVKRNRGRRFWQAIGWNWPGNWPVYVLAGFVLSIGLQALAHLLPMPKELPIDRFFQTPAEAWALSVFGMTLAPFFEEFFFRGFLYPVLARRLGVVFAVIITAASFGLIHAPQLGRAWGPVLVVFLVGLALTVTRAVTKSVAAGVVMHVAYNGTISVLLFWASDGFRHLEKLQ
jgi:membrane protease YdiL (CAAX protease family)